MSQDYKWDCDIPLPSVEDYEEIDLDLTDWETESTYSESESDRDFITTSDIYIDTISHDPSYYPSETEDLSSQSPSDDGKIMDPNSIQLGEYGPLNILDERDVDVDKGTATQFLISCWVDEEKLSQLLDLLEVPKPDAVSG
ncbi:uncharacterized protein BDV14DRAFT_203808 [Aspergillus stella-maris]|uniref:uncharacterized protein n=1 Tax=Aspergillus stella-maris TaxID=1810926 RepID=UPI003CCCBA57